MELILLWGCWEVNNLEAGGILKAAKRLDRTQATESLLFIKLWMRCIELTNMLKIYLKISWMPKLNIRRENDHFPISLHKNRSDLSWSNNPKYPGWLWDISHNPRGEDSDTIEIAISERYQCRSESIRTIFVEIWYFPGKYKHSILSKQIWNKINFSAIRYSWRQNLK